MVKNTKGFFGGETTSQRVFRMMVEKSEKHNAEKEEMTRKIQMMDRLAKFHKVGEGR